MRTLLEIWAIAVLAMSAIIIFSYLKMEWDKSQPTRRHKRIQKIIAHAKPAERGYSTPEGYMKKVELMDMRGELENHDHADY